MQMKAVPAGAGPERGLDQCPENGLVVVLKAGLFNHDQARAISRRVLAGPWRQRAAVVVIDLSRADDATTAAFAALVLLRRELLRRGGDLRLAGMRDRTRQVYAVNRLDAVLPQQREREEAEPIRLYPENWNRRPTERPATRPRLPSAIAA